MVRRPLCLPPLRPQARVPWVCQACLRQQQRNARQEPQSIIRRRANSLIQWERFQREIKAGTRKSMLAILEERGLVHTVAGDRAVFEEAMNRKRMGVYCGVDPTAPSLHVGHMLPFIALIWMYLHGFEAVSLVGGATSSIGDPTGRTTDRPEMSAVERKANMVSMHYQLKKIWAHAEQVGRVHGYKVDRLCRRALVNNNVWWNSVTFLEVLKFLGKGLRLGEMLAKDIVKTKMDSGNGMAFSEFCYPIMQGWDWIQLSRSRDIQIQIGGSDQYGNITSGMEAYRYFRKNHPHLDVRWNEIDESNAPYGFTVPLLTTATGAKFGKSAGNAVWLDAQMTSPFELYGFFVGTSDADVERFLKLFTFLPLPAIEELMQQHAQEPGARIPHHVLALEFVSLVHGRESALHMQKQHKTLFANRKSTDLQSLLAQQSDAPSSTPIDFAAAVPEAQKPALPHNPLKNHQDPRFRERGEHASNVSNKYAPQTNAGNAAPMHTVLPEGLIRDHTIARVLWSAGLAKSRSEGQRLASAGGAYIGRRKGADTQMRDQVEFLPAKLHDASRMWSNVIHDDAPPDPAMDGVPFGLLILRVGKWKVRICRIVADDTYIALLAAGRVAEAPGWSEHLALEARTRAESRPAAKKLELLEAHNQASVSDVDGLDDADTAEDQAADAEAAAALQQVDLPPSRRDRSANFAAQQRAGHKTYTALESAGALHPYTSSSSPPNPQTHGPDKRKWPTPNQPPSRSPRQPAYRAAIERHLQDQAARDRPRPSLAGDALRHQTRTALKKRAREQRRAIERAAREQAIQRNRSKILARAQRREARRERERAEAAGEEPRL